VSESPRTTDWATAVARSLAVVVLGLAIARLGLLLVDPFGERFLGNDLNGYVAGARRFLDTGSPFLAEQLSGSWQLQPDSFIHPPVALLLFVPFIVLPAPLWWLIPIGLTVAAIVRLRPSVWTLPVMAACLLWPRTGGILIAGNTDMWVAAAMGVTLAWSVPASVLLVMKPSYLPLAIIGITWRSWWVAVVVVGAVCLLFAGLWLDYLTVLRGAPLDPWYSLLNSPYVAIPVVAWLGRTRSGPERQGLLRRGRASTAVEPMR
jgi:hypothetical protein